MLFYRVTSVHKGLVEGFLREHIVLYRRKRRRISHTMAVLATKNQYSSMGIGPTQPVLPQYNAPYRKPVGGGETHNAPFLSPTESEFSDINDGQETVRYAFPVLQTLLYFASSL